MSGTPRVSVLMAVADGERFLAEAIDSVLSQTLSDFELIVVNDGSQDSTQEIIESYEDDRIVAFRRNRHGLANSLNFGLAAARSPLVARMDADDICLPERLAVQVSFLENHPESGVLGSAVELIDGSDLAIGRLAPPTSHSQLLENMWEGKGPGLIHPAVMFRRELVLGVGGYDGRIVYGQDMDLWFRLSRLTRFTVIPEVLLRFRQHAGSVSVAKRREQLTYAVITRVNHLLRTEGLGDPSRLDDQAWQVFRGRVESTLEELGVYRADAARRAVSRVLGSARGVARLMRLARELAWHPDRLVALTLRGRRIAAVNKVVEDFRIDHDGAYGRCSVGNV